jgi:hypothetical protein
MMVCSCHARPGKGEQNLAIMCSFAFICVAVYFMLLVIAV